MQFISQSVQGSVAVVVMNYKDQNAFCGPLVEELKELLSALEKDERIKAVVITGGNEKYFCTGLDLNWMSRQNHNELVQFLIRVTQILKQTALFPKPLIAAVNGHAFGLGAIWLCAFDFRIMREDKGWVCFPEMDINIPFLPGMIALCEHGLGNKTFREMAFTARRYAGPEAVAIGYAREAAGKDALLPKAIELAQFMASKAQPAFGLTKQRWAREVAKIIDELDPEAIRGQLPGK